MVPDSLDMTPEHRPLQTPDDASREAVEKAAGVLHQSGQAIRELTEQLRKEERAYAEASAVLQRYYGGRSEPAPVSPATPKPPDVVGPPTESAPETPEDQALVASVREPSTRQAQILALLAEKGALKCAEIQHALQAQYHSVFKSLKTLRQRGQVKQRADKSWELFKSAEPEDSAQPAECVPPKISAADRLVMILRLLGETPDPLQCSEIADRLNLDDEYHNVIYTLKRLEKAGDVEQDEDSKHWALTPQGKESFAALEESS